MDKARFEVGFEDVGALLGATSETPEAAGGPKGIDRITFLVSANPGEELRPLDRVASGGEISRLMLALKTVLRRRPATRTPKSARWSSTRWMRVSVDGRRRQWASGLKRLARENQVLSVTHLPQIACFADHHYSVEKVERAGRTFASVQYLATERERATELARMLSGRRITEAVLEHATAMLKQGSRR